MKKAKSFLKDNWLLLLAAVYVLSPIDILPDVVPVVGTADDFGVVLIELIRRKLQEKPEGSDTSSEG